MRRFLVYSLLSLWLLPATAQVDLKNTIELGELPYTEPLAEYPKKLLKIVPLCGPIDYTGYGASDLLFSYDCEDCDVSVLDHTSSFIIDDQSMQEGVASRLTPTNAEDVSVEFQLFYEGGCLVRGGEPENIYVAVLIHDDDYTDGDILEVMWAPYPDSLSRAQWPIKEGEDKDGDWHQMFAYWNNAGAYYTQWKTSGNGAESFSAIEYSDFTACYAGGDAISGLDAKADLGLDGTLSASGGEAEYLLAIPFIALTGVSWFDYGQKIALNLSYIDKDTEDMNSSTPDNDGFYHQVVWNGAAEDYRASMYYAGHGVFEVTGATPEFAKDPIRLFPNPVDNQLNIKGLNRSAAISIFNFSGQKLSTQEFNSISHKTLDVINLSAGMYFLEIRTADAILMKAFVKQ